MPTTTANESTVPVGSDPYALTADLKKAIEGVRSIIPVASTAERDGLAALFGGTLPVPTWIQRTDLNGEPLYQWDGSAWLLPAGAQGILNVQTAGSGDAAGLAAEVVLQNVPSFTFLAGRRYRVVFEANYYTSNLDTVVLFKIATASTADAAGAITGLTVLNQTDYQATQTNRGFPANFNGHYQPVSDTTVQLKVTGQRIAGSGTFAMQRSATAPNRFYVEDCGRNLA